MAAAASSEKKTVWYKVKDEAESKVKIESDADVDDLKKAIKGDNPHIPPPGLITIKTKEGKALKPGKKAEEVLREGHGIDDDHPLCVDFPGVEERERERERKREREVEERERERERERKREREREREVEEREREREREPRVKRLRVEQALAACFQMLTNLGDMQPVTLSAAATETRGTDWNKIVAEHYGTHMCIVLSDLFPSTRRPAWFTDDPNFRKFWGAYPAVAEHIVPKGQPTVALMHGVDVHSATNGLPLLRHLERQYQAGNWTLLPTQQDHFEVHVAPHLRPEVIRYYSPCGVAEHRVKDDRNQVLDFGRLHEKVVHFSWTKVSFRALFLKAKMAHKQNPDLPNPADFMDRFTGKCQKMKIELWQRLQASTPDPALAVVEENIAEE